jgi:hypothetical protein
VKKTLLTGIAALFLATGAAHAVGTCDVADPTGTPLNVRDRPNGKILFTLRNGAEVVPLEESNDHKWLKIFLRKNTRKEGWVFYNFLDCHGAPAGEWQGDLPAKKTTVLYDEKGGDIKAHWHRFRLLAESGDDVEIRGECPSACTLVMAHIPHDRLCFAEGASLGFHVSRNASTGMPEPEYTQINMINQYPQDIRAWIIAKGGVEKMTIAQMWTLSAEELWQMGYRKCGPDQTPIPMTIIHPSGAG